VQNLASGIDEDQLHRQMERIVSSRVFAKAARSQRFLCYLVATAVADPPQTPKEYTIAIEVFDRGKEYDPAIDATVRVEASRLRSRLREYYAEEGAGDALRIELPKGAYRIAFTHREEPEPPAAVAAPPALPAGDTPAVEGTGDTLFRAEDERGPRPASALKWFSSWQALRRLPVVAWRHPLMLVATLCLLGFGVWRIVRSQGQTPAIRSVAVLPLRNLSADPLQDYFADGMTDELITELARIPNLRVVSRAPVMASKDSPRPLAGIPHERDVDAIVEGSILRSGERIRITAQLIDAHTNRQLWAQSFEGSASEVLSLQDGVAQQIANQASLVLATAAPRPPLNPAAHDAYLRARYFFHKQDYPHSLAYFKQAVDLDPNDASAQAGYASALDAATTWDVGTPAELMPSALAAARRAIQLDPQNGEAYTALGSVQTIYEWNWNAAEQNLIRGIALNASDPLAEFKYSVYLDAVGRQQDAVRHMRRALQLDPLSFLMNLRLGVALYFDRQYDAALAQLERAAEMEEQSGSVEHYKSLVYEHKGNQDNAVQHDIRLLHYEWPQVDNAALLVVYQKHGWQSYWRARTRALLTGRGDACTAYQIGVDDLRANEVNDAFDSFQRALDSHCFNMAFIRVDPLFDSVRNDPRYRGLLARLHQSP
jgi:TolB-like protein/Tfp pilus assembly protein PilF